MACRSSWDGPPRRRSRWSGSWGYPENAGWFMNNPIVRNGWWLRVLPWLWKPPYGNAIGRIFEGNSEHIHAFTLWIMQCERKPKPFFLRLIHGDESGDVQKMVYTSPPTDPPRWVNRHLVCFTCVLLFHILDFGNIFFVCIIWWSLVFIGRFQIDYD